MFDVGCVQACPSTDGLTLNMVDDKSFRIERADFLSKIRKFKPEKIEKFTNALKAIHTTMAVAEAVIYPYGVVRGEGQKPTGLFSKLKGGPSKPQEAETGLAPGQTLSPNLREIPIVIDGVKHSEEAKKIVVKRCKKDNMHVTVPIITYLPLRVDDIHNSKF
jgi:hypothetical protein